MSLAGNALEKVHCPCINLCTICSDYACAWDFPRVTEYFSPWTLKYGVVVLMRGKQNLLTSNFYYFSPAISISTQKLAAIFFFLYFV